MQATYDDICGALQTLSTDELVAVIGDASLMLAQRVGQEPASEEPASLTEQGAANLLEAFGDVAGFGAGRAKTLAEAGYHRPADLAVNPEAVAEIDGIGASLALRLAGAAIQASQDAVPDAANHESSTSTTSTTGERVLAADARKDVPDGATFQAPSQGIRATVHHTDDGYTATLADGTPVTHPTKGTPLGNGSGLAWAIGEAANTDDPNGLKEEAYFMW